MNNEAIYRIPQTADSKVIIGNSRFCDDVWDLEPLISVKSQSPSRKKLKFNNRSRKLVLLNFSFCL